MAEQKLGGNGNGQMLLKEEAVESHDQLYPEGTQHRKMFFFLYTISIKFFLIKTPRLLFCNYQESKWIVNKKISFQ